MSWKCDAKTDSQDSPCVYHREPISSVLALLGLLGAPGRVSPSRDPEPPSFPGRAQALCGFTDLSPPTSLGLLRSQELLWIEMCPIKYKNSWRRLRNKGDWIMILAEAGRRTEEWKQIICRLAVILVHLRNIAILSLQRAEFSAN